MTLETENPYQAGDVTIAAPQTQATRWMIWTGGVALGLAVLCLIATVFGMMRSFDAVSAASSTPNPSDLANGIYSALIPSIAAVPLALLGVLFLILGLVRRRRIAES